MNTDVDVTDIQDRMLDANEALKVGDLERAHEKLQAAVLELGETKRNGGQS